MKHLKTLWILIALAYVAVTSAMVGGVCTQIFNPFLVHIILLAVDIGLLIAAQIVAVLCQRHKAGTERVEEQKLDDEEIIARLFEFDAEEPCSHERNTEIVVAHLAASLGGHPPRTVEEFLGRLSYQRLKEKLGSQACTGFRELDVERVHTHLRALCVHFGRALDGEPPSDARPLSQGATTS